MIFRHQVVGPFVFAFPTTLHHQRDEVVCDVTVEVIATQNLLVVEQPISGELGDREHARLKSDDVTFDERILPVLLAYSRRTCFVV